MSPGKDNTISCFVNPWVTWNHSGPGPYRRIFLLPSCRHMHFLKVGLSDLMDIYLIQNSNKLKVNYEQEDIPAVIEEEIMNTFKRIRIALFDF